MSQRRTLVYLHGLNSSGRSHKATRLREGLAPVPVLAPSYPAHRPHAAIAQLSAVLAGLTGGPAPVLVGSSLGGFYGQYLARQFPVAHLFLINPALTPWDLLPTYEGTTMTTADGETYTLTEGLIAQTRTYAIGDPCDGVVPTTLFLDEGDEVIDYRIAAELYRGCGRVLVYPGGDHAFTHLEAALEEVRRGLAKLG